MGNFETGYPVHGSAALKPDHQGQTRTATIIEFPSATSAENAPRVRKSANTVVQPTDYSQLTSLFTTPLAERKMVRSLREGSISGVSHQRVPTGHAIAGGVVMAFISLIVLFI